VISVANEVIEYAEGKNRNDCYERVPNDGGREK
jgi:hypothetical protein